MDVRSESQLKRGPDAPEPSRRREATPMPTPRRVYVGAALVGLTIAGLVSLGVLGASEAPQSVDFRFTRGIALAPGEEERLRGHLSALAARPDRLVRVVGHTGQQGDADANMELSAARAGMAASLAEEAGIPQDRLLSVTGVGGGAPLEKSNGVSDREWERNLSRVTVTDQARP